ncbi:WcaI family glycosyltransferase [Silvibacterium acidisoli]|uniref:WcaI family glycosyltransferase n=1 Tax=Acidobacteriaceae bacterium ZG23-2 TaxID=2883246 RepID=UPI00406C6A79
MRILLLGINYSPELTGIGKYSGEMMEWLASRGHEVRVVTAPPYYPAWKVREDYSPWRYQTETSPAGVKIYRCPLWVPERPSGISRMIHLGSFATSSLPVMLAMTFWRPDVVLTVEPAFFCAPTTIMTAMLSGAPAWLHVQDFEIDAAFDLGLLPSEGATHNFALAYERYIMQGFTRVSSISPNMVKRLGEKGIDKAKTILFPNWVDIDAVQPMTGPNRFREELGISDDQIVLLYSGNLGNKQGLEMLPLLAQQLREDKRLRFVFCGDGSFRPQLEEMTAGLHNVSLLPLQPMDRLNELLNAADIHLLPQKGDAADLVMPSKLTGMLASGRPVLATAAPGTQVAEAVHGRGINVPPGNIEAMRDAVKTLADSPELRREMGIAARSYAEEHLGREQVLRRFEANIKSLTAKHSTVAVSKTVEPNP